MPINPHEMTIPKARPLTHSAAEVRSWELADEVYPNSNIYDPSTLTSAEEIVFAGGVEDVLSMSGTCPEHYKQVEVDQLEDLAIYHGLGRVAQVPAMLGELYG